MKYVLLFFIFMTSKFETFSLRTIDGSDPYVPDYEPYYYNTIEEKMSESMSVNNCTVYGTNLTKEKGGYFLSYDYDLHVIVIPPPKSVYNEWIDSYTGNFKDNLFTKATNHLCNIEHYRDFKVGEFKRAKGCYKKYVVVNNQTITRINRYGATLHPDHVRCDVATAIKVCSNIGSDKTPYVQVPKNLRMLHEFPFIVLIKNAIIARSGMIAQPCGAFGLFSQCEALKWGLPSAVSLLNDTLPCRQGNCPYPIHNRVFILTQYDDTQIGQFLMETFPKIIYHLDYLKSNPDIKIHFGFTKRLKIPTFVLPHVFLNWIGLGHRLINNTVYAHDIIMPREGGCQDAGYNSWEVVTMREKFLDYLKQSNLYKSKSSRPNILITVRHMESTFIQNRDKLTQRIWPKNFLPDITELFKKLLPSHDVIIFSDINTTLMTCPLCHVDLFHNSDIVISFHGAGLSNCMFMRRGGVVVEVVPKFDSRHAPIVGIFPRLSSVIGLHHFHYNVEGVTVDSVELANDVANFYNNVRLWNHY